MTSSTEANDMSNIYDSPKVPPIPVAMSSELATSHADNETLQKQINGDTFKRVPEAAGTIRPAPRLHTLH